MEALVLIMAVIVFLLAMIDPPMVPSGYIIMPPTAQPQGTGQGCGITLVILLVLVGILLIRALC